PTPTLFPYTTLFRSSKQCGLPEPFRGETRVVPRETATSRGDARYHRARSPPYENGPRYTGRSPACLFMRPGLTVVFRLEGDRWRVVIWEHERAPATRGVKRQ